MRRSTPTGRLVPNGRSDQPRPSGGCPATEAISSNRRTGVQRVKGLSLQPPDWTEDGELRQIRRFDPCCLRRTNVHSASAAFPRGHPGESESSSGHARATGIAHPGFYGRKPWRKPNSAVIINVPGAAKEGLQDPPGRLPPNRSLKLTAKPSHPPPGYRHNRPKVIRRRSSRLRRALRVS